MRSSAFLVLIVALLFGSSAFAAEESLVYGRFGKLTLYRNVPRPSHVVLFVSGDGGWNLGVIDMARSLTDLDALVIGIDITHYLKELGRSTEKCSYPAADFANLSKFIQKRLDFDRYHTPILVGYSSGATLAYTLLAQAPPNTFRGAISMGFCPDLPLQKPFCPGRGLVSVPAPKLHGYTFPPVRKLENRWLAFQGTTDQVCDAATVTEYVKGIDNAELILLPKVGHGFSVQKNWLPQFRKAFLRLVMEKKTTENQASSAEVSDLPLIEVPAHDSTGDLIAVILTGDGGWASIDRDIGGILAAKGIPVVGLNTLQYFWTNRSPEAAGRDLERILRHYRAAWQRQRFLLIGYSLGADVLPFMTGYLPTDLREQVAEVALLGAGKTATFQFHLNDWLGGSDRDGRPILPELDKLQGMKVLCLYGKEEEGESLCPTIGAKDSRVKVVSLAGGHHFGGAYQKLAELILAELTER
jgi:type IV secretory pathway VirJ component